MTEIEKLEAEIAEKKAKLRRLKDEAKHGKCLDFSKFNHAVIGDCTGASFDNLLQHLRAFVFTLSGIYCCVYAPSMRFAKCPRLAKGSDLDEVHFRACNAFLDELFPIFEKYANIFICMNEEGDPHEIV